MKNVAFMIGRLECLDCGTLADEHRDEDGRWLECLAVCVRDMHGPDGPVDHCGDCRSWHPVDGSCPR